MQDINDYVDVNIAQSSDMFDVDSKQESPQDKASIIHPNTYRYGIHKHSLEIVDLRGTKAYGDIGMWICSECSIRGIGPILTCLKCNKLYCNTCLLRSVVGVVNML
jgi:hypothetical protein